MTKRNMPRLMVCALLIPLAACDDPSANSTEDWASEIDESEVDHAIDANVEIEQSEPFTADELDAPEAEAAPACLPPVYVINPRRSLFDTNVVALAPFSMTAVMDAVAVNAGYPSTPMATYNNIINNFAMGVPADPGSRCNDATALSGGPGLNGYPLECPRAEQFQDFNLAPWFPIAVVNRMDLMPADASTCGEQRLVMASNAGGRMFMIFEAVIPNPTPGCKEACRPIAEFWHAMSSMAPAARQTALAQAFLTGGHPLLTSFGPFLSADNLTFGSGQIRTNNFDQVPWTLREHKLADEFGQLVSVQVAVEHNIYGELWNDTSFWPQGPTCRGDILAGLGGLLPNDVNLMGIDTGSICWAAESREDPTMNYEGRMLAGSGVFTGNINTTLSGLGSPLIAQEAARRATYVGTCMGCHEPNRAMPIRNLGSGVIAPLSLGFVHTSETVRENCDGINDCWLISPALKSAFLPFRQTAMINYLTSTFCTSCSVSLPPELGVAAPLEGEDVPMPRPVLVPAIEDETDVEALMEYERELEAGRSKLTISGAPISRSH